VFEWQKGALDWTSMPAIFEMVALLPPSAEQAKHHNVV
jgi:hypothetical protein